MARPLSAPPPLLTEPHLFGEVRASCCIVRRHHRIVRRQSPFLAVVLRRHVVLRAQMALERLELLSVLEADDIVRRDRLLDGYRRVPRPAPRVAVPAPHPRQSS